MTEAMNQEPVYFVLAVLGTLIYAIKIVMLIAGGDGDGGDSDFDVDTMDEPGHIDGGATFTLVSIQSIMAFFMGAGWIGLACRLEWDQDQFTTIMYAGGFGFAMMLLSSFLTFKIKSLNATPKFDFKTAVGLTGRSYTNIPEKGEGIGQVEITINGKQQILQASSDGEAIKSFVGVKVVKVDDSGNLIVTKS